MAVGIVAYATYTFAIKCLKTKASVMLAIGSLIATLILQNAYAFPILIMMGGIISSAWETQPQEDRTAGAPVCQCKSPQGNLLYRYTIIVCRAGCFH
jgi:chromate transport protein ChrA